jgi:hypothetical protein
VGRLPDQIAQGVGIGGVVVEFLRTPVFKQIEPGGQRRVGAGQFLHPPEGGSAARGRRHHARAVGPRVEQVAVLPCDDRPHRVPVTTGVLVVFRHDVVTALLRRSAQHRGEGPAVDPGRFWQAEHFEHRGQQVHPRDEMTLIYGARAGHPGPAHHPRRARAVEIQLGLSEGEGHPVVGEEYHDGALLLAGFAERREDGAEAVVRATDGGLVTGEFDPHLWVVEEEAGHRDLRRRKYAARPVAGVGGRVLAEKRLVRVGEIEVQEERFPRAAGLVDSAARALAVGGGVLLVQRGAVRAPVEDNIPTGVR